MSALSISSISSTTRSSAAQRLAQRAELDVLANVADIAVAKAGVVEPLHGVVDVEPVLGLGGRLDVPGQQRLAEVLGDRLGQHGLAGARLAANQQRLLERAGDVHRVAQLGRDQVGVRAREQMEGHEGSRR